MTPLTVVTWKWQSPSGSRCRYSAAHVLTLERMVRRHYRQPYRFVCVTDDRRGLETIETLADPGDFASVPSPHGRTHPSCYRRLRLFAPDAGDLFGDRIVSLDLDTVITGDVTDLWDRPEAFVAWADPMHARHYNASMLLIAAGSRPHVWTQFDPQRSPPEALAAGRKGSDQGWITHCLGAGEAIWTSRDGVYSYRCDVMPRQGQLPTDARVVFFHGRVKPWDPEAAVLPWVRTTTC